MADETSNDPISDEYNCGGTHTATKTEQILTSPGYPNGYASNLKCLWTIYRSKNET